MNDKNIVNEVTQKPKITIGLDIGVASVGWAILDEEGKVLDLGSRLFDDASQDGESPYVKRRMFRNARRRIIRNRNRKLDLLKLFHEQGWLTSASQKDFELLINNLYKGKGEQEPILNIKCRCLESRSALSKEELMRVLYHYLQHRGKWAQTIEDEKDEDKTKKKKSESVVISTEYPSLQLKEFETKYGFYKGSELSESIPHLLWLREIKDLLSFNGLDESFIDKYLDLFNRRRSFAEGPGTMKGPSPYGIYGILDEDGKPIKNLWDKLVGKCSVYPNELRGGQNSPVTELFNLLNDLNNLKWSESCSKNMELCDMDEPVLTQEQKISLFKQLFEKSQKSVTLSSLSKFLNVDESQITGYKTNVNKGAPSSNAFAKLDNYALIVKFLKDIQAPIDWEKANYIDKDLLDICSGVFEIFRTNSHTSVDEVFGEVSDWCNKKWSNLNVDRSLFNQLLDKLKLSASKSASLSYKAMEEYIFNCGLKDNLNSSTYFNKQINENLLHKFANLKSYNHLPKNIFDDDLPVSPSVKKSVLQTIKIINKILKLNSKEFEISSIVIEMPRDKNSEQEKKKIEAIQDANKEFLKSIIEEEQNEMWSKEELTNKLKFNSKLREKVQLWKQQDKKDIYSLDNDCYISFTELMTDQNKYQVDHILPLSKTGMDGINNKVLTASFNNQEKGNRTPYEWLSSKGDKWLKFCDRVESLYAKADKSTVSKKNSQNHTCINKEKRDNLLFMDDLDKRSQEFIGRNLSDTRYASRLILQLFSSFFKLRNQTINESTNVSVITGKLTSYARNKIFKIPKDRNNYEHHAVDASIIAFIGSHSKVKNKIAGKSTWNLNWLKQKDDFIESFETSIKQKINNNEIKFSRKLVSKDTMELTNQTIYSLRKSNNDKYYTVSKINIFDNSAKKYFGESAKKQDVESLLIYTDSKNPTGPSELYKLLNSIYIKYFDPESKQNPFVNYMQEKMGIEDTSKITFLEVEFNNSKLRIKNLRKKENTDPSDNLVLKEHNSKACCKSLKSLGVRVYRNDKGKFSYLFLTANYLKSQKSGKRNKLVVDEDKVNIWLHKNGISNHNYFELKQGQCFRWVVIKKSDQEFAYKKIFYISGFSQANGTCELQFLNFTKEYFYKNSCSNNGHSEKSNFRIRPVMNRIVSDFMFLEMDELGNIYTETKIEDIIK